MPDQLSATDCNAIERAIEKAERSSPNATVSLPVRHALALYDAALRKGLPNALSHKINSHPHGDGAQWGTKGQPANT